ncbi:hypothetical protein E2320_013645, partial [Naja naja]
GDALRCQSFRGSLRQRPWQPYPELKEARELSKALPYSALFQIGTAIFACKSHPEGFRFWGPLRGDRSESEREGSEVEEVRLEGLGSPHPHLPESQSDDRRYLPGEGLYWWNEVLLPGPDLISWQAEDIPLLQST